MIKTASRDLFDESPTVYRPLRAPVVLLAAALCILALFCWFATQSTGGAQVARAKAGETAGEYSGLGSLSANPAVASAASSPDGRYWVYTAPDGVSGPEATSGTSAVLAAGRNGAVDVFLFDRYRNQETLISSVPGGLPSGGDSGTAAVSADGRIVVFSSRAANLTPAACDHWAIYVKDRQADSIILATRGWDGSAPDGDSFYPSLSADGRLLAFVSYASNLVEGDDNGKADVFITDLSRGETRLISRNPQGQPADGHAYQPLISANGKAVVFVSAAGDIQPQAGLTGENVYRYDVKKETLRLVSSAPGGVAADGASWMPAVSADGTLVAFASYAENLVTDDRNGVMDVFLFDTNRARIVRISARPDGGEFSGASWLPAVSADGSLVRFITLEGAQSRAAENQTAGTAYLYDRRTGNVRLFKGGEEPEGVSLLRGRQTAGGTTR